MFFEEHECEKDMEMAELQDEKETLEWKIREERNKNYRLQVQLIEALSKKPLNVVLPDAANPNLNEIQREEKDGVVIYRGHLHISKEQDDMLKEIPNHHSDDRTYIRKLFETVFGSNFLKQYSKQGIERSKVLESIESSADYHTMKAMYEMRIFSDGTAGGGAKRCALFKEVIRKKANNIWQFQKSRVVQSEQQNDTQQ